MASTITLKKSSVNGRVPAPGDLNYGELALNYADGLLYYKKSNNTIQSIGSGGTSSITASLITSSTIGTSFSGVNTLTFDTESGFSLTNLTGGAVKVGVTAPTFKTFKITGQADVVASGLDTIQFVAGTGITINTNPTGSPYKSITINSTATAEASGVLLDGGEANSFYGGIASIDAGGI
ncbi:hypothetical protein UFOVP961_142 [uncultured Caudovirales phage]|uniref:Major tropism determinant N-terminal domain-containing protein n=1 Tax=uncultured Caudovirales phage TaxID=2100421 RepID=A0A6J5QLE1_9CAUD|nr:hypothetical protein UFOVP961_142 [uncultured Caudovirales phage]CAB4185430.1 hypothetical protein UFOVP1123_70 [uncultured Caudovirales phage]CAB4193439.1 hypothetical protein UFOVP1239_80 [uncultured Caudovirales phage]CAB4216084.1 hypothetical protein UFOVP1484_74 [uncultured Caudovirales phage]CAB5230732.1 hypothetical protein UFOVP1577_80 [uncultured Caudovirales phage]